MHTAYTRETVGAGPIVSTNKLIKFLNMKRTFNVLMGAMFAFAILGSCTKKEVVNVDGTADTIVVDTLKVDTVVASDTLETSD